MLSTVRMSRDLSRAVSPHFSRIFKSRLISGVGSAVSTVGATTGATVGSDAGGGVVGWTGEAVDGMDIDALVSNNHHAPAFGAEDNECRQAKKKRPRQRGDTGTQLARVGGDLSKADSVL